MSLEKYACKRAYLSNDKLIIFLESKTKYVGEAKFTDHILKYKQIKNMNTDKNLLWCREIHKNVWPTMKIGKFYPFQKSNIKFESGFQFFTMSIGNPLIECNSLKEAKYAFREEIEEWFSFQRTTQEYLFEDISIYLENVEKIGLSIEFVCRTESNSLKQNMIKIDKFMKEHEITKIISHQVATLILKKL